MSSLELCKVCNKLLPPHDHEEEIAWYVEENEVSVTTPITELERFISKENMDTLIEMGLTTIEEVLLCALSTTKTDLVIACRRILSAETVARIESGRL
jgi:hypothetical protein